MNEYFKEQIAVMPSEIMMFFYMIVDGDTKVMENVIHSRGSDIVLTGLEYIETIENIPYFSKL